MNTDAYPTAVAIATLVAQAGGRALVVGGYVRDKVLRSLGKSADGKDIDIEVYGLELDKLQELLAAHYSVDMVGASFGVLKVFDSDIDVSVPRRDSKVRDGHRGFDVSTDPHMSIQDAARRRDFTMNAMAYDPLTEELIDPFGGQEDIRKGILRVTDPQTFIEDPLRVLRAMQFAGRFEMQLDPALVTLCRSMDLSHISKERIGEEWKKLLLKSSRPSIGLQAGRELGVIQTLHPSLAAIIGIEQWPDWHPEGDVWTHACLATDAAAQIVRDEQLPADAAYELMLAALCHDLGKAITTRFHPQRQRLVSYGHEAAGVKPARQFLRTIDATNHLRQTVPNLVLHHMFPPRSQEAGTGAIRRLAQRLAPATIEQLCRVARADQYGRGYVEQKGLDAIDELLSRAHKLGVADGTTAPLVLGRDILQVFPGIQPGPELGDLLKQLYEAQLDGMFTTTEEGVAYAHKLRP